MPSNVLSARKAGPEQEKAERFFVLSDEEFDRLPPDEKTQYLKRATSAVAMLVAQLQRMFTDEQLR